MKVGSSRGNLIFPAELVLTPTNEMQVSARSACHRRYFIVCMRSDVSLHHTFVEKLLTRIDQPRGARPLATEQWVRAWKSLKLEGTGELRGDRTVHLRIRIFTDDGVQAIGGGDAFDSE